MSKPQRKNWYAAKWWPERLVTKPFRTSLCSVKTSAHQAATLSLGTYVYLHCASTLIDMTCQSGIVCERFCCVLSCVTVHRCLCLEKSRSSAIPHACCITIKVWFRHCPTMCVVFREVNNLLLCYKMGRVIVETNSSASHTNKYVPYCTSS